MKIKYILNVIIIISCITEIKCQDIDGMVIYSTYRNGSDIEENKKITKSLNLFNDRIEKEIKKLKLSLIFSRNESSFTCIEPMHINQAEERIHFMARILQKVYPNYYTKKTQYIEEKDLGGELFLIKRNIDINDWKLVNEKKKIGNYICYKAIRNHSFVAADGNNKTSKQIVWYTLEIPIHFGPKNFVGFPGLVLKVIDGNLVYEVSKIVLNPKERVIVKQPSKKGKEISEKEYNEILEGSSTNIRREINKRKKVEN